MLKNSNKLAYIVSHAALGLSILFASAICFKNNISYVWLPIVGIITALGCFYLYYNLVFKKITNLFVTKIIWTLSGIFMFAYLFSLIKVKDMSAIPYTLWILLIVQLISRFIIMFFR